METVLNPAHSWKMPWGLKIFLLYIYPILVLGLIYSTWFLAVNKLGFEPIPTQHDPKFYGGQLVSWLHWPGGAFLFLLPIALFFAGWNSLKFFFEQRYGSGLVLVAIWLGFIVLFISQTPVHWYID